MSDGGSRLSESFDPKDEGEYGQERAAGVLKVNRGDLQCGGTKDQLTRYQM